MRSQKLLILSLTLIFSIVFIQNLSFAATEAAKLDAETRQYEPDDDSDKVDVIVAPLQNVGEVNAQQDETDDEIDKCCLAVFQAKGTCPETPYDCGDEIRKNIKKACKLGSNTFYISRSEFVIEKLIECKGSSMSDLELEDDSNFDITNVKANFNPTSASQAESQESEAEAKDDDDDELKKKYMYGDDNYWN